MVESIKKLRELTGFGVNDCKKAFEDSKGNLDKALSLLKEKGARILAAKKERKAKEGLVDSYIHFSQKLGALVEVNCETDFVARNEEFKKFVKDLAVHIAAASPKYIAKEDVMPEDLKNAGTTDKEGFFKTHCLLEQPYAKDNSKTIADYLNAIASKFRENIVIRRFSLFSLGE